MSVTGKRRTRIEQRLGLLRWVSIVLVVFATALLYFAVFHKVPLLGGEEGREFHVTLAEAHQVSASTPVRLAGVDVGQVTEVQPVDGGRASRITFRVTDDDVVLHDSASAGLRFRTLLGGRMQLVLDPGSPTRPRLSGGQLRPATPPAQTEVDDVLQIFDGRTRNAQRTLLRELPRAFGGDDAGRLMDELAPALRPTATGLRALGGTQQGDLRRLVAGASRVVAGTGRADRALRRLVTGANRTFGAAAARADALAETMDTAPATMAEIVRTAHEVDATLPDVDRLIADLQPAAPQVGRTAVAARPAVRELNLVLRDARPLTRDLDPAVRRLAAAARSGRTLLELLPPTVTRLREDLIPMLQRTDTDLDRPLYQIIGPTLASLVAFTSNWAPWGHFATFDPKVGANSIGVIPCTVFVGDPTATQLARCDALNGLMRTIMQGRKR